MYDIPKPDIAANYIDPSTLGLSDVESLMAVKLFNDSLYYEQNLLMIFNDMMQRRIEPYKLSKIMEQFNALKDKQKDLLKILQTNRKVKEDRELKEKSAGMGINDTDTQLHEFLLTIKEMSKNPNITYTQLYNISKLEDKLDENIEYKLQKIEEEKLNNLEKTEMEKDNTPSQDTKIKEEIKAKEEVKEDESEEFILEVYNSKSKSNKLKMIKNLYAQKFIHGTIFASHNLELWYYDFDNTYSLLQGIRQDGDKVIYPITLHEIENIYFGVTESEVIVPLYVFDETKYQTKR